MGNAGETVADAYKVTRDQQDAFAAESHQRAAAAHAAGRFKDEILPVSIPQKKGDPLVFDRDESVRADTTAEIRCAPEARVQEGRHGDRRQCAAGERRRRGARRDGGRACATTRPASRWRASSRKQPAASSPRCC